MVSSRERTGHLPTDRSSVDEEVGDDGRNKTASLFIVILSLIFVVIFGGALIAGIASGDPTNAFFITIIVASIFSISVALGVLVRYIVTKRADADNDHEALSKRNMQGTFSQSDEENLHEERPDYKPQDYQYPGCIPVESEIREIEARSVVEEMSALSPTTYDEESLSTFRHHIIQESRREFFTNVASTRNVERVTGRQDPPEGVGLATIQAALKTRGSSQDPSAPKFSTEGGIITDIKYNLEGKPNQLPADDKSVLSRRSRQSRIDPEDSSQNDQEDNTVVTERSQRSHKSGATLPSKTQSPYASSEAFSLASERKQKEINSNPPSSTKSGVKNTVAASPVPPTPAASEAGSFASSFFKPLNGMFGKSKKAPSEVGSGEGDTEDTTKQEKGTVAKAKEGRPPMVRPPMMPSNKKEGDALMTIGGRGGSVPSTPGNKSTFTIPPPRPVPRTPMGSEFQSVAGSTYSNGAASSTFDPLARQKAIQKMRMNQASIGASPVDVSAMQKHFDEDDDEESSVGQASDARTSALSYDVFAPPGALGIIIDTTDKGCIVYSLKKSSAMQGLMNRGDLIIGLDNFDVRSMNAASLTKLMAKKSKQAERKFTLIPKADI